MKPELGPTPSLQDLLLCRAGYPICQAIFPAIQERWGTAAFSTTGSSPLKLARDALCGVRHVSVCGRW